MIKIRLIFSLCSIILLSFFASAKYSVQLQRAAEKGDSKAQYILGNCYEYGAGIEKNTAKALFWWKLSAKNGNLNAKKKLGKLYENGWLGWKEQINDSTYRAHINEFPGVGKSIDTTLIYYEAVAVSDDFSDVQKHLGELFYEGKEVERNYDKAFIYLKRAANNEKLKKEDRSQCMNKVAVCYRYGRGTEIDIKQSEIWREKAALLGYQDAQDLTGKGVYGILCFENGVPYKPDGLLNTAFVHKKTDEGLQIIPVIPIIFWNDSEGKFSLSPELAGIELVMSISSDEYEEIEFIGGTNLKLILKKKAL